MAPFIDIHTHHASTTCCGYSFGIHPWKVTQADVDTLETFLREDRIAAIGETGIDRLYPDTLSQQLALFERHILLSEAYKKPLIIHNVRATDLILQTHRKLHPRQTWIIHGFNGNVAEARQLIDHGIRLSVGESLFDQHRKITKTLLSIPLDSLFFETDTSNKTIQQVYEKASALLNLPLEQLKEQIFTNFARLNLNPWMTGNNAHDCSSATMALINWNEATC